MKSRTAAVIVTYNRKELLVKSIESLLAQKPEIPDIIVVDNHSTDGTEARLEEYIRSGRIEYFDTGSNLGGAGGFHCGIKHAAEEGYEYVWVMDDDCVPDEYALRALHRAGEKLGTYGFLASKVLWKDGTPCVMNVPRETLIRPVRNFGDMVSGVRPVTMASFVSLFLPVEIIREVGLPIKEFFIWTDDWEYTRRISRKYPCYIVADSVVAHMTERNKGADISEESSARLDRFDYLYRNDVYLYRREGLRGFTYEAARLPGHCFRVLAKSKDHRAQRIGKIIRGTVRGLHFHPEIEYIKDTEK